MDRLSNYISEKLFADIDDQMKEELDNHIKSELIKLFSEIDKSHIKIHDNKINIDGCVELSNENTLNTFEHLIVDNGYIVEKISKLRIINHIRNRFLISFPEFLKGVEVDDFILHITRKTEIKDIDVKVNKEVYLRLSDPYIDYKNINITALKDIKIYIELDSYSRYYNNNLFKNMHINADKVKNFRIKFSLTVSTLRSMGIKNPIEYIHSPEKYNADINKFINTYIYPWMNNVQWLKEINIINISFVNLINIKYNIEQQAIL